MLLLILALVIGVGLTLPLPPSRTSTALSHYPLTRTGADMLPAWTIRNACAGKKSAPHAVPRPYPVQLSPFRTARFVSQGRV